MKKQLIATGLVLTFAMTAFASNQMLYVHAQGDQTIAMDVTGDEIMPDTKDESKDAEDQNDQTATENTEDKTVVEEDKEVLSTETEKKTDDNVSTLDGDESKDIDETPDMDAVGDGELESIDDIYNDIKTTRDHRIFYYNASGRRVTQKGFYQKNSSLIYYVGGEGVVTAKLVKSNKQWKYYSYSSSSAKWSIKKKCWANVSGTKYYFNDKGLSTIKYYTASKKHYQYENGAWKLTKLAVKSVNSEKYFFNKNGVRVTKAGLYKTAAGSRVYVNDKGIASYAKATYHAKTNSASWWTKEAKPYLKEKYNLSVLKTNKKVKKIGGNRAYCVTFVNDVLSHSIESYEGPENVNAVSSLNAYLSSDPNWKRVASGKYYKKNKTKSDFYYSLNNCKEGDVIIFYSINSKGQFVTFRHGALVGKDGFYNCNGKASRGGSSTIKYVKFSGYLGSLDSNRGYYVYRYIGE